MPRSSRVFLAALALFASLVAFPPATQADDDSARGLETQNNLALVLADPADACAAPGSTVTVLLTMSNLSEPVTGYQAFLHFDTAALTLVSGTHSLDPFPLPFGPIIATPEGNIDLAAGTIGPGTTADAVLASMDFLVNTNEGPTQVVHRVTDPPSRFTKQDGEPLTPTLYDSPTIVITSSTSDADGDGVPDPCDRCPCFDDAIDTDGDGFADGCDTFGDHDHDGDVDLADHGQFVGCLSGPATGAAAGCLEAFDREGNLTVDLADFAEFQRVFGFSTCN